MLFVAAVELLELILAGRTELCLQSGFDPLTSGYPNCVAKNRCYEPGADRLISLELIGARLVEPLPLPLRHSAFRV